MKQRNLIMMVLAAMLLAVPMSVSAYYFKSMGWLHLGEGSDSYYDQYAATVPVKYNGTTYQAYPVAWHTGVYYVPNEKNSGTKNENLKILYLKDAKLTDNIRCTKSATNLVVVVSGNNSISYGSGSNFKLEKGNLFIVGESGSPANDKLTVNQTGKYQGAYTSKGSISIMNVTLWVYTKNTNATLSQEYSSGKLTIINSNVTTNNPIYAKGGVALSQCSYTLAGMKWDSKTKYIVSADGTKAKNILIAVPKPTTTTTTTTNTNTNTNTNTSTTSTTTTTQKFSPSVSVLGRWTFTGTLTKTGLPSGLPTNDGVYLLKTDDLKGFSGKVYWIPSKKIMVFDNLKFKANYDKTDARYVSNVISVAGKAQLYFTGTNTFDVTDMTVIDCVTGYKLDMYSPSISGKPCSITANLSGNSMFTSFYNDSRICGTTITVKGSGNANNAIIQGFKPSNSNTKPQLELDFCTVSFTKTSGTGGVIGGLHCLTMKRCGLDVSYQKQDLVFDGSKGYLTLNGTEIKKFETNAATFLHYPTCAWTSGSYPKWNSRNLSKSYNVAN